MSAASILPALRAWGIGRVPQVGLGIRSVLTAGIEPRGGQNRGLPAGCGPVP
jgi:hypothetical protein